MKQIELLKGVSLLGVAVLFLTHVWFPEVELALFDTELVLLDGNFMDFSLLSEEKIGSYGVELVGY